MGFPRQKSLSLLRQPHIPTARPCRLPVLLCQVLLPGEAHLAGAAAGRAVPAARCSARRGEPPPGTAGVMNQSLAEGSAEPPRQPGYSTITALLLSLWLLVPFSSSARLSPAQRSPGRSPLTLRGSLAAAVMSHPPPAPAPVQPRCRRRLPGPKFGGGLAGGGGEGRGWDGAGSRSGSTGSAGLARPPRAEAARGMSVPRAAAAAACTRAPAGGQRVRLPARSLQRERSE